LQGGVPAGDVKDVLLLDVTAAVARHRDLGRGSLTKLIPAENTTIPTKAQQVFSTADDNQSAVTIHVLPGRSATWPRATRASASSTSRASPPSPARPCRQDRSHVRHRRQTASCTCRPRTRRRTGKENKITIKASSGLTEDEIQRMVKDAEAHADEDKKQLGARHGAQNQAEAPGALDQEIAHRVRRQLDSGEKDKIDSAIKERRGGVLKGEDKAAIEEKSQALAMASQKLGEKTMPTRRAKNAQGGRPPSRKPRDTAAPRRKRATSSTPSTRK